MFHCGGCGRRMFGTKVSGTLAWSCPSCGSNALTLFALRPRIPPEDWRRLFQTVRSAAALSKRTCPACRGPMRLARFPAFSLDWCRPCTLLWFDRNELESLPSLPVPEAPPPLSPEATAALAEFYRSQRPREVTVGDVVRTTASQVGLPVEVEAPPLRWFPAMTAGLSALLLIGWLSEASAARFALTGFGIDLLRYPFARTGFVTLAANLYLLWLFGDNVEDLLGLGRYLALFGGAGVVAGLFHLGLGPATPLAGATPSIVALAVFYAARFPRARLRAAGLELPAWGGVIVSALAVSAIGWIFREFSLVSLLGGALAGLVAAGPELLRGMEARRGGSLRGRPSGSGG